MISNLRGVYLFRNEPGQFARRVLSADAAAVDATYVRNRTDVIEGSQATPVIYQIDLTQADG